MPKAFEIDFVRQIIVQTLKEEFVKAPTEYFGNENQVRLTSFYEHLASDEEVNRYVETVRDLINQQNRTGLIANGTILAPENPTITNLNQCTIIPLSFSINFRCTLANRDKVKVSLDNVVKILKGRKFDVAEFDNGQLFKVGTLGNNSIGVPLIRNGDFIGVINIPFGETLSSMVNSKLTELKNKGFVFEQELNEQTTCYLYGQLGEKLIVIYGEATINDSNVYTWDFVEIEETSQYTDIIFPPEHVSFKKWCVSMSFDSFRCSEPRTLNAEDYCDLSFGGSATISSVGVMLGNQLTKLGVKRYKIVKSDNGASDYTYVDSYSWLEPLEMPSGNNADTQMNQLIKNNFINNTHTNGISITNQYTFIIDESIDLIRMWFDYARYGIQSVVNNDITTPTITPNTIYDCVEIFSKWGNVNVKQFKTKVVESIDIENTESDTLTISIPMQLQGEYN